MNKVLVVDKFNRPLRVTYRKRAFSLIAKNKAYIHSKLSRKIGFTVIVLMKEVNDVKGYTLGIDLGETEGYAIIDSNNNQVILTGELKKRNDIKGNLESRKANRRIRRGKLWYRKPKFKSCQKRIFDTVKKKWVKKAIEYTKPKNWLPPTIKSKINISVSTVNLLKKFFPINKITAEIGQFDTQLMMNPEIQGEEYQNGVMRGSDSIREFIILRDEFKCHYKDLRTDIECGGILEADHMKPKSKGGVDNPTNRVCSCHNHNQAKSNQSYEEFTGKKIPKQKDFKATVFMNISRDFLIPKLKELNVPTSYTFGYITRRKRNQLNLEKSHTNDAISIAVNNTSIPVSMEDILNLNLIHFRKKKRSLHEETPRKGINKPNRNQRRNEKNTKEITVNNKKYCLGDTVLINTQTYTSVSEKSEEKTKTGKTKKKMKATEADERIGYISGYTGDSIYIKSYQGKYLQTAKTYLQVPVNKITVIRRNNNIVIV